MIFADTSFWIGLRARRDERHRRAVELLKATGNRELFTTDDVRGETWTLLRARIDHAAAVDFLDHLERSPRVSVLHIDQDLGRDALAWLRKHDERPYSYVDATSFAVMRAKHIRSALTFDREFEAAGFEVFPG